MSFLKLAYSSVPFEKGMTPRALFEHVRGPYSCLLESGEADGDDSAKDGVSDQGGSARYSYIVCDPFLVAWSENGVVQTEALRDFGVVRVQEKRHILGGVDDGWPIQKLLEQFRFKDKGPVPFCGGAVGFLTYDYGCRLMEIEQQVHNDLGLPDYMFGFYNTVIAVDHEEGKLYFMALGETDLDAKRALHELEKVLERPAGLRRKGEMGAITVSVDESLYAEKIERVHEFLRNGETYQVNFSVRFEAPCTLDAWSAYERLTEANPSPFACYLEYPEMSVVSCSPELLVRKRGMDVETWPIKGTVSRGRDKVDDKAAAFALLSSEKNEAELAMIVDLARNDVGKVCDFGTVKVASHRDIEQYSHVIHTVSRVVGRLRYGTSIFDVLKAVFPGGSITGCPKKRTMEIIDQLEHYRRGVYTGSAGFLSFGGDVDLNILIRTMLFKDEKVFFHAGGGIVADSEAGGEYEEVMQKAQALREAVGVVNS